MPICFIRAFAIDAIYNLCFRSLIPCYDYIQAATLHLLDMDWQLYDLPFLVEINLPQLQMEMAKGSSM